MTPLQIKLQATQLGAILPLSSLVLSMPCHLCSTLPCLPVGTILYHNETQILQVVGRTNLPSQPHSILTPLLQTIKATSNTQQTLVPKRSGYALATITLSDQGAAGTRQDESGPVITSLVSQALPIIYTQNFILPDEPRQLAGLIMDLTLNQGYDLVISSGGTGLSPRDTTPEAISPLLERRLPGFEQAMAYTSFCKTPTAIISRAIAGTIGQAIVITLPGSKKAVAENLQAILPGLDHALAKLQGDHHDCGGLYAR